MPGPPTAASRRLPIPSTPSTTRPTAVRADRRRAAGHHHVQLRAAVPAAVVAGARTARPVPRLARRHGAARQPGLDGLSVLSLGKSKRVKPIDFRAGNVTIRVEGTQEHGIATIWDADVLIWAASQIVEAKDAGLRPSRLMRATPYEILRFIGRGSRASRPRWIACNRPRWPRPSARQQAGACTAFVDQRMEGTGRCQRHAAGHRADPAGLVLCRRARRRAGADHRPGVFPAHRRHRAVAVPPGAQARRQAGIRLAVRLSLSAPEVRQHREAYDFACDLRALVARQSLPGYVLGIERMPDNGMELLTFRPAADGTGITPGKPVNGVVLSGVRVSCYQAWDYRAIRRADRPQTRASTGFARPLTSLT